jgi:hypothetical protein
MSIATNAHSARPLATFVHVNNLKAKFPLNSCEFQAILHRKLNPSPLHDLKMWDPIGPSILKTNIWSLWESLETRIQTVWQTHSLLTSHQLVRVLNTRVQTVNEKLNKQIGINTKLHFVEQLSVDDETKDALHEFFKHHPKLIVLLYNQQTFRLNTLEQCYYLSLGNRIHLPTCDNLTKTCNIGLLSTYLHVIRKRDGQRRTNIAQISYACSESWMSLSVRIIQILMTQKTQTACYWSTRRKVVTPCIFCLSGSSMTRLTGKAGQ